MSRIRLAALATLLLLASAACAGPVDEALKRAEARGVPVVALVGADWLVESTLLEHHLLGLLGDVPCEPALIWAGDTDGQKAGLGVSVLAADGSRLARLEALDALEADRATVQALLERAALLAELKRPERGPTLTPDDRREWARLAAQAGDPASVREALELGDAEPTSPEDRVLLAQAAWNADDNATCEKLLAEQAPEVLALLEGLPRYWLGACRLSPPKDEASARQAVADLEALAGDDSAGTRARLLALDVLRQFAAKSPETLAQLLALAEELAPGSARAARIASDLADVTTDDVQREEVLAGLEHSAVGRELAGLCRARAAWPAIAERAIESAKPLAPVARIAVIAPDTRAFLRELARWSGEAGWPVLLADSWYCRLFLCAYAPERVYLAPAGGEISPAAPWQAAAAALGPEELEGIAPETADMALLERVEGGAPGCVLWEPGNGLECAAALLAAGRAEPLVAWSPEGAHADTATPEQLAALRREADRALDATGRAWRGLGDGIDFVTLACDLPYRTNLVGGYEPGGRALDDVLLRGPERLPQAFVGRLLPDPVQAVYAANCALFLTRERALLFDTYGGSPPWSDYSLAPAAARLPELGFTEALSVPSAEAGVPRWASEQRSPFRWDQVAVNSSGGFRDWSCGTGGCSDDIAQVGPTFVSYVHSHAAGMPLDPDSIVGRWLTLGCYGFYGSVIEPYLQSFRPSSAPVIALAEGWPAGLAWRQIPGEAYWGPWRLALLGDPLCGLPIARAESAPELPLPALEPERDLPSLTPTEAAALAGDWTEVVELAMAQAPTAPRDRALLRSALIAEMAAAIAANDAPRACLMLRGWHAASGEAWTLPRLAARLEPLVPNSPEAKAAIVECLRTLAGAVTDEGVRADLTKRADAAAG